MNESFPPQAKGLVLSTLNSDGSRRFIVPKVVRGRWYHRRMVLGYALIALFAALPFLRIDGRPAVLFDLEKREFLFFGARFLATDTLVLMLFLLLVFLGIFFLTAVFGRSWCGYGCPQTVYMEFVFRPIESFFSKLQRRLSKAGDWVAGLLKASKLAVFAALSLMLANIFLAYFVGTQRLSEWMLHSPGEQLGPFLLVLFVAVLIFFDFAYFREQMCTVACPYARLQAALLDRQSVIIGYDGVRGEPRGKKSVQRQREQQGQASGDCIDCNACVLACPTGIDIRNGLQMECIACAQCIDACDAIMTKVHKPLGLIRYGSQESFAGRTTRWLRGRTLVYPILMAVVLAALIAAVRAQQSADVTVLRGIGAPFTVLEDGRISNQVRIKIVNRSQQSRRYDIALRHNEGLKLIAPENPMTIAPTKAHTTSVFVVGDRQLFERGVEEVEFVIGDDEDFESTLPYTLVGPSPQPAAPVSKEGEPDK